VVSKACSYGFPNCRSPTYDCEERDKMILHSLLTTLNTICPTFSGRCARSRYNQACNERLALVRLLMRMFGLSRRIISWSALMTLHRRTHQVSLLVCGGSAVHLWLCIGADKKPLKENFVSSQSHNCFNFPPCAEHATWWLLHPVIRAVSWFAASIL